jgi:hypothetical protein
MCHQASALLARVGQSDLDAAGSYLTKEQARGDAAIDEDGYLEEEHEDLLFVTEALAATDSDPLTRDRETLRRGEYLL